MTIALPSIAISPPATMLRVKFFSSRCASSMTSATSTMPASAVEMRQPTGFAVPNAASPMAISHLPNGGCATNAPSASGRVSAPDSNRASASSGQRPS